MEIRANNKYYQKLKTCKNKIQDIPITLDENVEIPVVMIKTDDGKLVEYLRGFKQIKNYLKFGYNRIIKSCPFRHKKCIGEKCSLYFIKNGTGDCALIWNLFQNN